MPFVEVPRVTMEGPSAVVLSRTSAGGRSTVRARVVSKRGARTLVVLLPAGARVSLEGQAASPRNGMLVLRAVPAEGVELTVELDGAHRGPLTLLDVTPGLPPASAALTARAVEAARDSRAVQTQEGDVTIAARRIELDE